MEEESRKKGECWWKVGVDGCWVWGDWEEAGGSGCGSRVQLQDTAVFDVLDPADWMAGDTVERSRRQTSSTEPPSQGTQSCESTSCSRSSRRSILVTPEPTSCPLRWFSSSQTVNNMTTDLLYLEIELINTESQQTQQVNSTYLLHCCSEPGSIHWHLFACTFSQVFPQGGSTWHHVPFQHPLSLRF